MSLMPSADISSLDLDLLKVLDALFEESSVTEAARRLGVSQPSVSRGLAALREWFGAPLFVRTRAGLVATTEARALRGRLRDVLSRVDQLREPHPSFDAATSTRIFRIGTAEYAQIVMLGGLVTRLAAVAPAVGLVVEPWSAKGMVEGLETGRIELAIAPAVLRAPHIRSSTLLFDTFVTIHRRGHALATKRLTRAAFASARHLQITPDGREGSILDDALFRYGLKRRIALRVPSFAVAPMLVASSDLVATVPARLIDPARSPWPLETRTTPLRLPALKLCALWHERAHEDAGLRWLRQELARLQPAGRAPVPRVARIDLERRAHGSL